MTKSSLEIRQNIIENKVLQIVNPEQKCVLCGQPIANKIYRKENVNGVEMIVFYFDQNQPEANMYIHTFSKLLCDAHMRVAWSKSYKGLNANQMQQLKPKFNEYQEALANTVTKSKDPELIKLLFGKDATIQVNSP